MEIPVIQLRPRMESKNLRFQHAGMVGQKNKYDAIAKILVGLKI